MRALTKSELIEKIAQSETNSLTQREATEAVTTVFELIVHAAARGVRTEIRGFCSFSIHARKSRLGRNPRTGESVQVPAKNVIRFRAGRDLAKLVDGQK